MSESKICLVTGATGGIGLEIARGLAKSGATVVMSGRDSARGEVAREDVVQSTGNDRVHLILADLSAMREVERLAKDFDERFPRLDLLVNNAALLTAKRELTVDGFEKMFAVNHLAVFRLTQLLLPKLKASAPSQVINISSNTHRWVDGIDFNNLQAENGFNFRLAYGAQKLMNLLHAREISRRFADQGVIANAHHPGEVATNLGNRGPWYMRLYWKLAAGSRLAPEDAAEPIIAAALSGKTRGVYFECGEEVEASDAASSKSLAAELWEKSEALIASMAKPR